MYMWLCIEICGAVVYHVTMMFCLFGSPLPPFFLLHSLLSVLSIHPSPLPCSPSGSRKKRRRTAAFGLPLQANVDTGQFPFSLTDPVALDTGTAQRVLPPEIDGLNEKKKNLYIYFSGKTVKTASSGIIHPFGNKSA